jgi:hypothetical protein
MAANSTKEARPAAPTQAPVVSVDAFELFLDYERNELAADGKYKNKTLLVSGVVSEITKDPVFGNPQLYLYSTNEFIPVIAEFPHSAQSRLASMSAGLAVDLKCMNVDYFMSPILSDCSFQ